MKLLKDTIKGYKFILGKALNIVIFFAISAFLSLVVVTPLWYLSQNHGRIFTTIVLLLVFLTIFFSLWNMASKQVKETGSWIKWINKNVLPIVSKLAVIILFIISLALIVFALNGHIPLYIIIPAGFVAFLVIGKMLYGFQVNK
ncbi:hypothetical protein [Spirochaeta cellobiosiphila]|uniref:hypothetical protein n=1 Tax=Spirochaeta cellobiosiphila TaxID=504483 RepID=UPI00049115FB|nr:hypothetical protein [Spirochaeta cellobiosiphila]